MTLRAHPSTKAWQSLNSTTCHLISWVLPWVMPHPFAKCHGNYLSGSDYKNQITYCEKQLDGKLSLKLQVQNQGTVSHSWGFCYISITGHSFLRFLHFLGGVVFLHSSRGLMTQDVALCTDWIEYTAVMLLPSDLRSGEFLPIPQDKLLLSLNWPSPNTQGRFIIPQSDCLFPLLLLIARNSHSETLYLFSIYRASALRERVGLFKALIQIGQQMDREEIFTESDKSASD